jgi:hypothetical protein
MSADQAYSPRFLEGAIYATQQRRYLMDIGFLVSIMVMMLSLIPAPLIVPALSDLGHPGTLMALLLFGIWVMSRMHPRLVTRGQQPMRWIIGFFFTTILASYAAGLMRGMPTLEDNAAIRHIIGTLGFFGAVLAVADGVPRKERLEGLIRVMLLGGGIMAVIGIIQSVMKFDITAYIQIPGLVYHGDLNGLASRGAGQLRVNSTAGHYIEFSTVMALMLPFAVHMGRFSPTRAMRQWAGISGALMFLALPMALSRTGIVALAVGMLVMVPAWNWRMRFNLVIPTVVLMIMLIFAMPGLLGTVLGLFSGWDTDPSVQGREEDWAIIDAQGWMTGNWIFGRGHGTFIPTEYIWLDSQWTMSLIGGGILGVFALALFHLGAITLATIAFRRSTSLADRHLCACLIATQMIAIAVGFTFDSLGFRTYAFFLAILTGASAAMWRFTRPARTPGLPPHPTIPLPPTPAPRRFPVSI